MPNNFTSTDYITSSYVATLVLFTTMSVVVISECRVQ